MEDFPQSARALVVVRYGSAAAFTACSPLGGIRHRQRAAESTRPRSELGHFNHTTLSGATIIFSDVCVRIAKSPA